MVIALFLQLLNDCWKAFRGESIQSNLIFTRKRSSLVRRWIEYELLLKNNKLNLWTEFEVFLKNNNTGVCDFNVKANLYEGSLNVHIGESKFVNTIAQVYFFDVLTNLISCLVLYYFFLCFLFPFFCKYSCDSFSFSRTPCARKNFLIE